MSKLFVVEAKVRGNWTPTPNVMVDGRKMKSVLDACKFQFPKIRFRKATYVREEK